VNYSNQRLPKGKSQLSATTLMCVAVIVSSDLSNARTKNIS